jgi:uncharacterized protein YndB with AHSA1/START domain
MSARGAALQAEKSTVMITRTVNAPRKLVFAAFTDPVHIAQFWGPAGFASTVCEMDLRPGGKFRLEMRAPDGAIYTCEGTYREIVAPERVVYAGGPDCGHPCGGGIPPQALVTITLAESAGQTTVTIETCFESADGRDAAVKHGFSMGWKQTLARLANLTEGAANLAAPPN